MLELVEKAFDQFRRAIDVGIDRAAIPNIVLQRYMENGAGRLNSYNARASDEPRPETTSRGAVRPCISFGEVVLSEAWPFAQWKCV